MAPLGVPVERAAWAAVERRPAVRQAPGTESRPPEQSSAALGPPDVSAAKSPGDW